jgi:hypothetical protein
MGRRNNLGAFLFLAAIGGLADDRTAGDAGWQQLLLDWVVLPAYAVAVIALHRRFRLATRTAPEPDREVALSGRSTRSP